jgi:hypothetical protein
LSKHKYVILSRSHPGREDEYERWYGDQHLADVCRCEGVVHGELYRLELQKTYELDAPQWSHMTIYDLECEDPQSILGAIVAVSGTGAMPLSGALTKAGMVQAVGHLVASHDSASGE